MRKGNLTQMMIVAGLLISVSLFLIPLFPLNSASTPSISTSENKSEIYHGKIYHIFFHSLVIYPNLAFQNDKKGKAYRTYMITVKEFKKILNSLYAKKFVLIDIHSIYSVNDNGQVVARPLYLPAGKKPLILSLDDLSYYSFMKGRGFANKLVLDKDRKVATEVITPENNKSINRDGDVVPIVDDFVSQHPDFSINGAKGVIAITGFEGILGYRTQNQGAANYESEVSGAKTIVEKLKSSGWQFADHSYSHDSSFTTNSITLPYLQVDTERWKREVETIVGKTDIFIGPFGQVFKQNSPKQKYLISQGFRMLCGVGMDLYLHYFTDHVIMDRANIDGFRLINNPELLKPYFDPTLVIDPARKKNI